MALLIFRLAGIERLYWGVLLVPGLAAYACLTGLRASVVRACIMAAIMLTVPLLKRRADALSSLALAAILITAFQPLQAVDAGFILSFVVVLGLLLIVPALNRLRDLLPARKPDAEEQEQLDDFQFIPDGVAMNMPSDDSGGAGSKWFAVPVKWVAGYGYSLLSVSVAAWIASAPLTAYYFGRFCPVALLANLVVVPMASIAVILGAISLAIGVVHPVAAVPLNLMNARFVLWMVDSMRLFAAIPGGNMVIERPGLIPVLLWYAVVGIILLLIRFRRPVPVDGNNNSKTQSC